MYQFWKGELTVGDLKARDITFLSCALFHIRMDLFISVLYFRYYICFKWSLFVKEEEKTSKIGLFFEGLPSHRWKMGRKGKKNDSLQEFIIQHFNALANMENYWYNDQHFLERKFKQRWSTIPPISTKRTITPHLKSLNITK